MMCGDFMLRSPDLAGRVLDGRYELLELIGEGTFGRVYRGRDVRLERAVAVKVIKPWWAEDPVWLERFAREARTLARVNHEGIVQIYDVGQTEESPYYVAELMEGGSLADRLREGPLAPAEAVAVALQLSLALGQAHSQHVIHRDVKPANILLGAERPREGRRLRRREARRRQLARRGGDRHRHAALHVSGAGQGHARRPPPATSTGSGSCSTRCSPAARRSCGDSAVEVAVRHLNDPPPPLPGSVPPQLGEVVTRALSKDPGDRFRDGAALANALGALPVDALAKAPVHEAVAETLVVEPATDVTSAAATALAPPRPPSAPPRTHRSRRWRPFAVIALLLAIGGVIALVSGGSSSATVPELRGLSRAGAQKRAHNSHVRVSFKSRYADNKKGTVIAQQPRGGKHVRRNSRVRAVVSAGPRPIDVPNVVGRSARRRAERAGGRRAALPHHARAGARQGARNRDEPVTRGDGDGAARLDDRAERGAAAALAHAHEPQVHRQRRRSLGAVPHPRRPLARRL